MKKFIPIFFILNVSCAIANPLDGNNTNYQVVNGYNSSSTSEKENTFCYVINDQKSFTEKFYEAPFIFTNGNITKIDFEKEIVIGVVKYGNKYWEIKGDKISNSNKKLKFSYSTKLVNDNMTWVASIPYIVKINKTDIDEVEFEENGKIIQTVSLKNK